MSVRIRPLLAAWSLPCVVFSASAPAASDAVALVNGKPVPQARVDLILKEQIRQGKPATPELSRQAREEAIAREVLSQEAARKLNGSEALKARLDFMQQQALVNALREDFFLNTRPGDEEVRKVYDSLSARAGERDYRVRHILVDQEAEARALIEKLNGGARFEDLARTHSRDRDSAPAGGLLAWTPEGSFAPGFGDRLPKMGRGSLAPDPVRTRAGWHVIKLEDVRPSRPPAFDEVRPRIAESLIEQKWREYVQGLRSRAVVK